MTNLIETTSTELLEQALSDFTKNDNVPIQSPLRYLATETVGDDYAMSMFATAFSISIELNIRYKAEITALINTR